MNGKPITNCEYLADLCRWWSWPCSARCNTVQPRTLRIVTPLQDSHITKLK